MSRTKRYVPHWARSPRPYELSWRALSVEPKNHLLTGENPRNRIERGYDRNHAMSGVYLYYRAKHVCYREEVTGKTRKFYKRNYHKSRRKWDKWLIDEYLFDLL